MMKKFKDLLFTMNYPSKTKWLDEVSNVINEPDMVMVAVRECVDDCTINGLLGGIGLTVGIAGVTVGVINLVKAIREGKTKKSEEEA